MTAPFVPHGGARDPERLLDHTLATWGGHGDVWVFGYASLIWRPEFEAVEDRAATVHGWHRALAMRSRVNRGTAECPGLVFALVPGGSCRGRAYRIEQPRVDSELRRLWTREMPSGVYDPRWQRPRPCLHAESAKPQPHRASCRRRAARDLSHRERPLRQHAFVSRRDRALAANLRHPRPRRRAPGRARATSRADGVTTPSPV